MIKPLEKVRFIYQKARHHRTFHADGAWASITPQLEIQVAFFNDLKPMPVETTHQVEASGVLGEEVERIQSPEDVIREVDITLVMSKDMMKRTIELLSRMVKEIEDNLPQITKESQEQTDENIPQVS